MEKSVLITGAAGNLGRAITEEFLRQGFRVTAIVAPQDDIHFMKEDQLSTYAIDLLNESDAALYLQKAISENGPVSVAVFTVGGFSMGEFPANSLHDIRDMIKLNFETAYTSARVLFEHYQNEKIKGRMVFIGARPGLSLNQSKEMVGYGLSKSLVFGLADIINASGKSIGIDAAVIVPSIIDTPANRKAMPEANFDSWVKPELIARNIHFLASEEGSILRNPILKVYGDS